MKKHADSPRTYFDTANDEVNAFRRGFGRHPFRASLLAGIGLLIGSGLLVSRFGLFSHERPGGVNNTAIDSSVAAQIGRVDGTVNVNPPPGSPDKQFEIYKNIIDNLKPLKQNAQWYHNRPYQNALEELKTIGDADIFLLGDSDIRNNISELLKLANFDETTHTNPNIDKLNTMADALTIACQNAIKTMRTPRQSHG